MSVTRAENDSPESEGPGLRPTLGFWTLTAFGVGDILGAGIYALIGAVAAVAGRGAWLSFLLTVGVAMLTALSYAELGGRFPSSGGESHFCQRAFRRPGWALLIGYLVFASGVVSLAVVSQAFVGYGSQLLGQPADRTKWLLVPLFLSVLTAVACAGIRQSSWMNVVCTVIEASGLLLVAALGSWFLLRGRGEATRIDPLPVTWLGIFQGAGLSFYAFIGFEDMVNVAEEVKNARRNIPAAILAALGIAAAIYLWVAWVATHVIPSNVLSNCPAPLLEVVSHAAPWFPIGLFGGIAIFAVANTGLLNLVMGSRLLYGMAGQGLLPKSLHVIHPRTRTPARTILLIAVIALLLALSGTLPHLAGTTNVLLLIVFFAVNTSLVRLKWRGETSWDGFQVPIFLPLAGMLTCSVLMAFLPLASWLAAGSILGIGLLLALIGTRRARSPRP